MSTTTRVESLEDPTKSPVTGRTWKARVGIPFVGVAVLVGVVAIVWWVYLPQYRAGLGVGERYGVDVSSHQGEIDWDAVTGDNIDFAYIKATEGGDFIDARFERNWAAAQAAGLEVGAYHFFTLCRSGSEQARNFLDVVPSIGADLAPALDLEFPGNCAERPPVEQVRQDVAVWLDEVEEVTGQEVLLYIDHRFDDAYSITDVFGERTWHRRILRRPGGDRWDVWQFSFFADVNGIDGGVDLNVMRSTG